MEEIENPPDFSNKSRDEYHFAGNAIIITIVIFIFFAIGTAIITVLLPGGMDSQWFPIATSFGEFAFLLLPVLIITKYVPMERKELLRLNFSPARKYIIWGLIAFIALKFFSMGFQTFQDMIVPQSLRVWYDSMIKENVDKYFVLLKCNTLPGFLKSIFIGAISPAICEEFLFRGYLQRSLEERLAPKYAILISALLFAGVHLNLVDLVGLIMLGILLGYMAYSSKSILPSILIHFANNFIAVIFIFITGIFNLKDFENSSIPVSWSILLIIIGLGLLFYSLKRIYVFNKNKDSILN
jgi:uncharacterized protein